MSEYRNLLAILAGKILDSEKLNPNLLRISIDNVELEFLANTLLNYKYRFTGMLAHSFTTKENLEIELQYFFSMNFSNRDYQLIVCTQLNETIQNHTAISINKWFPASAPFETKISQEWGIIFNKARQRDAIEFHPFPSQVCHYMHKNVLIENLEEMLNLDLK